MNDSNGAELPITAICIVSDKSKCPTNYTALNKCHDTSAEGDLWKDSLFGRKVNRFICFTKDYPIGNTYNVIEDIKLLNEREQLSGFIPLEKCQDTSEKAFQRKVLCVKISQRYFTTTAVSEIILLGKTKRPPNGYSYLGEVNGHAICIRYSLIPNNNGSHQTGNQMTSTGRAGSQQMPPPIPPRPYSTTFDNNNVEKSFEIIPPNDDYANLVLNGIGGANSDRNNDHTSRSLQAQQSQTHFNPLQGVPFEINPAYNFSSNSDNRLLDLERIDRKLRMFNETLEKTNYDFKLERSLIES